MLIDLEQQAAGTIYSSEICVLGAGIAGLILAHRLAARGIKVHLLEAGGLELEERSQQLYQTEMAGDIHAGSTEGRFRVFGGSSTRWGGQLLPYTSDIFSPGKGMPSHPWPIGSEAIEEYYPEVQQIMGVDQLPFNADLLPAMRRPKIEFGDGINLRFSKWAPFGRRNLAKSLGRECLASTNITVFLHANVTTLHQSGNQIESVTVKNYSSAEFRFQAKRFVICLGTIESSRLLLASNVGNQHDQVGRYFHDHIGMRVARFEGEARQQILERLGPFYSDGTLHTCKLEASPTLREREALPAVMAHIVIEEPEDSGTGAVRAMLQSIQRGRIADALGKNLLPMLRGIGDIARLAWASRMQGRRAVSAQAKVWLKIDMEQVAKPDDRIRLAGSKDALGLSKAVIDWHVSHQERTAALTYAQVVKKELELSGITGLVCEEDDVLTDTFHAMGGSRMGADPAESVVDCNLKVHEVQNLFVASCGVFPAGGSSNPTFTMMALTLRLADHLLAGA